MGKDGGVCEPGVSHCFGWLETEFNCQGPFCVLRSDRLSRALEGFVSIFRSQCRYSSNECVSDWKPKSIPSFHMESLYVVMAGLKLLYSRNSPASASQIPGTRDVSLHSD